MRTRLSASIALSIGVLAACTATPRPATTGVADAAMSSPPSRCQVPASGRPEELAERGIGGTGGATRQPPPPPGPLRPSLGVAGIIDGFGSVCLNGLEVGLLPDTTVTADDAAAAASDLRIGQQAVLAAAWSDGRPVTNHLVIRHAVIGPVDRVEAPGVLIVAGQAVRITRASWVDAALRPGRWIAVSGLRMPSGDILASRIDPAAGPLMLVHGLLAGTAARPRIGELAISPLGSSAPLGSAVVLRGLEVGGRVEMTELRPDLLADDPVALFGGRIHHFLIQTLIGSGAHPMASLNLDVAVPPGMAPPPGPTPAVIGLDANASGILSAQHPDVMMGGLAAPSSSSAPPAARGEATGPGGPGTQAAHSHRAANR